MGEKVDPTHSTYDRTGARLPAWNEGKAIVAVPTLVTGTGHAVRTKSVVFCCGYEFPKGISTRGVKVISTWALASTERARCPDWLHDTLLWEASSPYLYARMGGKSRRIVGGEDEASPGAHQDPLRMKRKARTIAEKVRSLIPGMEFEGDYAWAGAFGDSATGLPVIGRVEGMDHCWAVKGFCGNGITYSVLASQIVAAELRGDKDPDADLFRP